MLRSTQLVSDQARKCMAACPHASYHPASPLHKCPVSAIGWQAPYPYLFSLPTVLVLFQGRQETKGKSRIQANAAGIRVWGNSLDSHTHLSFISFLPWGIFVRRNTWRWMPLVQLIKRPSKLHKWVLHSLEHQFPKLGLAGAPLPHGMSVSSVSCLPSSPELGMPP